MSRYPIDKAHHLTHPVHVVESHDKERNITLVEFSTEQTTTFDAMRNYIAAHMEEIVEPRAKSTIYFGYVRAINACVAGYEPLDKE